MCNTWQGADDVFDCPPDLRLMSTNASLTSKGFLPDRYFRDSRFNGGMRSRSEGKIFQDGGEGEVSEGANGGVNSGTGEYV